MSIRQLSVSVTTDCGVAATVGTPVTRRPPCSPGRAVFPHPVPRLDSRPRKTCSQANTRRRLTSVMRGRSMWLASKIWVKRAPLKLRRFPPRRYGGARIAFGRVKTLGVRNSHVEAVPALQGARSPLRPTGYSVYASSILFVVRTATTPPWTQDSIRVGG